MLGWFSADAERASLMKRARLLESAVRVSGSNLMATVRSRRPSRALYTTPIPPCPIFSSNRNGPSCWEFILAIMTAVGPELRLESYWADPWLISYSQDSKLGSVANGEVNTCGRRNTGLTRYAAMPRVRPRAVPLTGFV